MKNVLYSMLMSNKNIVKDEDNIEYLPVIAEHMTDLSVHGCKAWT